MNQKIINAAIASTLTTMMATPAFAEADWKTQAELGIVNTSGNTETSTISAKIDSVKEAGQWRHSLHAEALNTSTANATSAERYQASAQSDYKTSDTDYFFGLLNYEKDRFSGFEYQAALTAGYGKRVMSEADMTLDLEAGPGVRFYEDTPTMNSESDPLLYLGAKYLWKISDNAQFTEDLTSEIGSDLTVTKSVTGLSANIDKSLAMKFTFTVKNTSDVPVGSEKTDTETAVTLVYSF